MQFDGEFLARDWSLHLATWYFCPGGEPLCLGQPYQCSVVSSYYAHEPKKNLLTSRRVDQPVGTGYSVGTPTAISQEETAQDFIKFFKNFQKIFGIKNFKIYVTGESYAGRYVPYISAAMLDENDKEHFDLDGELSQIFRKLGCKF